MNTKTNAAAADTTGAQDTSGWGLLGLAVGIVTGFLASFYLVIPLFPKDRGTLAITLMTTIVTAAMTVGGGFGYLMTRRQRLSE